MTRICPIHGLWRVSETQKRCPACSKQRAREYDKSYRNKEASKFYHSRAWKKVRDLQLAQSPLCEWCGEIATIADHRIPISQGGAKLDRSNLQSLCHACHNIKTAEDLKNEK